MKKILILILVLFFIENTKAQSIERQVIGSSGTTLSNASVNLDFTVGELAVTTMSNGSIILTQGFHQGSFLLSVKISPIAKLQGASLNPNPGEEALMRDDLRIAGYIPTISPYGDGLICASTVLSLGGTSGTGADNDDIVDWVFVELRDVSDNTIIKSSQSALLQRDGHIVSIDGISDLLFNNLTSNDFYIAIRHRNHLSIMSANSIALSVTTTVLDFTDANNQITFGTNAQSTYGMPNGAVGMWAGNAGADTSVRYQGSGNDTNTIKDNVLADVDNITSSNLHSFTGYNYADVNLDGTIRYQGSGNDSNTIKDVILAHPNNQSSPSNLFLILEQLPEN
ncbi:MAG: hemagglutinin protein [Kordia sp.]|nr:MAG: hemagglutinin protein [Kordia sp.]